MRSLILDNSSDYEKAAFVLDTIGQSNIFADLSGVYHFGEEWRLLHDEEFQNLVAIQMSEVSLRASRALVLNICANIRSIIFNRKSLFSPLHRDSVGMSNGDLILTSNGTWKFEQKKAENKILVRIPHEWDPNANAPLFSEFLDSIFEGDDDAVDKANLVLELLGYAMQTHCDFETFAVLVGNGANGKSVLLKTFAYILGEENVSAVQPSQLFHSFHRATLQNKLANIVSESEQNEKLPAAQVKAIVSGEAMSVDKKYAQPFTMKPFSTIFWATNHLPSAQDYSGALFRRARVIEFNNSFDSANRDVNLFKKLQDEASGIIRMALSQYAVAVAKNAISTPDSVATSTRRWMTESDSVATWVEYCMERVLMNDERSKDCYDHYYAWCRENGHIRPVTHTMFGKRLDALGLKRHRTSKGIFYRDLRLLVE